MGHRRRLAWASVLTIPMPALIGAVTFYLVFLIGGR